MSFDKLARDFLGGLGSIGRNLLMVVSIVLLIAVAFLVVTQVLYPYHPWSKYSKEYVSYIENLEQMRIDEATYSSIIDSSNVIHHSFAKQNKILNFLLDQQINYMRLRFQNSKVEHIITSLLLMCLIILVVFLVIAEIGARKQRKGNSIFSYLLIIWKNHKSEISITLLLTISVLGMSLYFYNIGNLDLKFESFSSSGLPFIFFGTIASVLGCFVTFIVYRTLRHRLISWPALLYELRKRILNLTEEADESGSPADFELNVLLYSPNPGQVSFSPGTDGYKAFESYHKAIGKFRECLIPARVICFTNAAIWRMINKLSVREEDRQKKFKETLEFIDLLEKNVETEGGTKIQSSPISVWRHGGVPNTHFYYGGHKGSPKWSIRFLIHRERNGAKHEVSGFDTEESMELGFAEEVFEEYLHEIASPIDINDIQLNDRQMSFDLSFYAQTGVSRLDIFAGQSSDFEANQDSLLASIPLNSKIKPKYIASNGESVDLKYAQLMRISGSVQCKISLNKGIYYLRGMFVKSHNLEPSGNSEIWIRQIEVK